MSSLDQRALAFLMILIFSYELPVWAHSLAEVDAVITDTVLADSAEVILTGRVLELSHPAEGDATLTEASIAVETVIKGRLLHSPVVVRVVGGEELFGSPSAGSHLFLPQQRVLLFLEAEAGETSVFDTLYGSAGAFPIFPVGDGEVVGPQGWHCEDPDLAKRAVGLAAGRQEPLRDLSRFSQWLIGRASGHRSPADYWLDAELPVWCAESVGFLKVGQSFGEVTDPSGDVEVINVLSNQTPDYVSAQVSSTGTELRIVIRHVQLTFDPELDRTYFFIDIDEDPATGFHSQLATIQGYEFLMIIQENAVRVDEWDPVNEFQTVGNFSGTILADGYLVSIPLALVHGDAEFAFRMANEVRRDNRHTALLDHMPDLNRPWGSTRAIATVPVSPGSLQATAIAPNRIDLTWSDNSDNELLFEVERRIGGGSFQRVATLSANVTQFQDTGVVSGTTHVYRVRARNEAGVSGFSNTASATTSGESAPTDLDAVALSTSDVRLSWVDNASGETGYAVEMQAVAGGFSLIQTLGANSATAIVDGLDQATAYTFRVRATGGAGDSSYSNEASATTFSGPTEPCVASSTTLCLQDGRFRVEVTWGDFDGNTGPATDAGLSSADSGLFYFFSQNNWEMLVKVLDGCSVNDRLWVFAAATTDVEYTVVVTDTFTGFAKTYENALGTASPAITDTDAFATCAALPPPVLGSRTASVEAASAGLAVSVPPSSIGPESLKQGTCVPDASTLCLNQGRFRVEVDWVTQNGRGVGTVDAFQSADSGLFWFFSPDNVEMLVKVLDACAFNDRAWVFAAATTDVEYTLTVTDTVTGEQRQYVNAAGNAADTVTDTDAFASCS